MWRGGEKFLKSLGGGQGIFTWGTLVFIKIIKISLKQDIKFWQWLKKKLTMYIEVIELNKKDIRLTVQQDRL